MTYHPLDNLNKYKPYRGNFEPLLIKGRTIDLANVESDYAGFNGGVTDGRYIYLSPNGDHGNVVMIDPVSNVVSAIDLASIDEDYINFGFPATDGRYLYFPQVDGQYVIRIDSGNFTTDGVTVVDLSTLSGYTAATAYDGYVYLAPGGSTPHGNVVKIDISDFTTNGVTSIALQSIDADYVGYSDIIRCNGYICLIPYDNSKMVKIDTSDFSSSGVDGIDLGFNRFTGAFSDGICCYLVPGHEDSPLVVANPSTNDINTVDLDGISTTYRRFTGGTIDHRYGYFADFIPSEPYLYRLLIYNNGASNADFRVEVTEGITDETIEFKFEHFGASGTHVMEVIAFETGLSSLLSDEGVSFSYSPGVSEFSVISDGTLYEGGKISWTSTFLRVSGSSRGNSPSNIGEYVIVTVPLQNGRTIGDVIDVIGKPGYRIAIHDSSTNCAVVTGDPDGDITLVRIDLTNLATNKINIDSTLSGFRGLVKFNESIYLVPYRRAGRTAHNDLNIYSGLLTQIQTR